MSVFSSFPRSRSLSLSVNGVQAGSRLPRSLASAGLDDIIQPSFWSTSNFSLKMNQRAARRCGERPRQWDGALRAPQHKRGGEGHADHFLLLRSACV